MGERTGGFQSAPLPVKRPRCSDGKWRRRGGAGLVAKWGVGQVVGGTCWPRRCTVVFVRSPMSDPFSRRKPIGIPDRILTEVEEILEYKFRQRSLLRTALIHASVSQERAVYVSDNKNDEPERANNERLEFLGDSVLYMALAEILFAERPELSEGDMTAIRARLLTGEACAAYVRHLGLDKYLVLGKHVRRQELRRSSTVIGDYFEAILGAIYIDGGLEAVKIFLRDKVLASAPDFTTLTEEAESNTKRNYRNVLQAFFQKHFRALPSIAEEKVEGPDHDRRFTYSVLFQDKLLGTASGVTKKQAVNLACFEALQALGLDPDDDGADEDEKDEDDEDIEHSMLGPLTEDEMLQSWPKVDFKTRAVRDVHKLFGVFPKLVPLERIDDFHASDAEDRFVFAVSVDDSIMAVGSGRTKKEAEQRACRRFLSGSQIMGILRSADPERGERERNGLVQKLVRVWSRVPDDDEERLMQEAGYASDDNLADPPAQPSAGGGGGHQAHEDAQITVEEPTPLAEGASRDDVRGEEHGLADAFTDSEWDGVAGDESAEDANGDDGDVGSDLAGDPIHAAQRRLREIRAARKAAVVEFLDLLYSHGVLGLPVLQMAREERLDSAAMLRWVERISRASAVVSAALASHYAGLVSLIQNEYLAPKLREEVTFEVFRGRTLLGNLQVIGEVQSTTLPNGKLGWIITGRCPSSVPLATFAQFFTIKVYPDLEALARGHAEAEVLVPRTNGVRIEREQVPAPLLYNVRICDLVVPGHYEISGLVHDAHKVNTEPAGEEGGSDEPAIDAAASDAAAAAAVDGPDAEQDDEGDPGAARTPEAGLVASATPEAAEVSSVELGVGPATPGASTAATRDGGSPTPMEDRPRLFQDMALAAMRLGVARVGLRVLQAMDPLEEPPTLGEAPSLLVEAAARWDGSTPEDDPPQPLPALVAQLGESSSGALDEVADHLLAHSDDKGTESDEDYRGRLESAGLRVIADRDLIQTHLSAPPSMSSSG